MLALLDRKPSLAGIFSALWHIVAEIPTNIIDMRSGVILFCEIKHAANFLLKFLYDFTIFQKSTYPMLYIFQVSINGLASKMGEGSTRIK